MDFDIYFASVGGFSSWPRSEEPPLPHRLDSEDDKDKAGATNTDGRGEDRLFGSGDETVVTNTEKEMWRKLHYPPLFAYLAETKSRDDINKIKTKRIESMSPGNQLLMIRLERTHP